MFVAGIIEKAQADSVPLLFAALGLVALVISAQEYTGGIGYRGLAFICYGKRIWQFSNRLFGGILMGTSLLLYLIFRLSEISASNKVLMATISCFLCALICDIVTLIYKKKRIANKVDKNRK